MHLPCNVFLQELEKWSPIVLQSLNLMNIFDDELDQQTILSLMIDLFQNRFLFIESVLDEFIPNIASIINNNALEYGM